MCLGVPGRIESVDGAEGIARSGHVDFGGVGRKVSLAFVPEAGAGDWVLVHVGFALSMIDEDEAQRVFSYLSEIESEDDPG